MKVRILEDANHRISSALSQSFTKGSEPNVPASTAKALIKRGVAERVIKTKSEPKGD